MRAAAFLDLPYSVTAHAYDIYAEPANLREKLERAAFATSGCDYTVNDLRAIAPQATVHKIVMGVDGDRFKRTKPYPGGRTVVAVGRLVEKKGFEHLIDAVGILEEQGRPVERVVIAGDGPLHATLGARARDRGVAKRVTLAGARTPAEIRQLLEEADLLAMPSVIAENGDRDSMPVAVKEALAMEVPVVASDEVGLPEIVKPPWGRLAPPGDAAALADAIDGQLGLPDEDRRAGRAFVLEHASVMRETERLAMILDEARGLHPQTESERR
jgi:glycosyltransferase involved in cell wall biosynthesis